MRQFAAFAVLNLVWGSTWMAIRIVVAGMSPMRSVALRLLFASVVLMPILFVRKVRLPSGNEWGLLLILSVLMIAAPLSLVAWATQRVSTSIIALLFATSPLLTAWMEKLLGFRSSRAPFPRAVLVGMFGGVLGVALLLFNGMRSVPRVQLEGMGAVVAVVVAGSMMTVIAKRKLKDIPALTISAVETLMAGVLLGLASLVIEGHQSISWTGQVLLAMVFLGVFSSALGFFIFYWLLLQIEPHLVATRYLIMPMIAITEGLLYLHEQITVGMIAGAVAVLGSLVIVLWSEAKAASPKPLHVVEFQ